MTRPSLRRTRACVAVGLTALVLAACGSHPVRTGAAATVGGTRIPDSSLQQVVARGLSDPQAQATVGKDAAKFQRESLSRLIQRDVLAEAARVKGVSVTEGQVDQQLAAYAASAGGKAKLEQQAHQNGIAQEDLRPFVHDVVLNDLLADKLTADVPVPPATLRQLYTQALPNLDQVHVQHILVKSPALAKSLLAQVTKTPASFAALAARYSIDTSNKAKAGDLGFAGRGSYVKPFEQAVFAAKPGTYLAVTTQFGTHVVHVLERRTVTFAQATPRLRREALGAQRSAAVQALLRSTSDRLGVTVSPRFGRWDATKGSVVEVPVGKDSVSSPGASSAPSAGQGSGGQPTATP